MPRLTIKNEAATDWQTTLEKRAYLLLPSLGNNLSTITINFSELPAHGVLPSLFRCAVSSSHGAARYPETSVQHPKGEMAIDGAMLRFRRQVERMHAKFD